MCDVKVINLSFPRQKVGHLYLHANCVYLRVVEEILFNETAGICAERINIFYITDSTFLFLNLSLFVLFILTQIKEFQAIA